MGILLKPSDPWAEEGWGPRSTCRAQSPTCWVHPEPQGPAGNRKLILRPGNRWVSLRGSQDRTGPCIEFPAGKSLSRCGDSQGVGRGRRGLAEMQKHPEAAKATAGGASLTEHGDPKVRAWGWGRVGRGAPPTCSSVSRGKPGQASAVSRRVGSTSAGTAGAHPPDPSLA